MGRKGKKKAVEVRWGRRLPPQTENDTEVKTKFFRSKLRALEVYGHRKGLNLAAFTVFCRTGENHQENNLKVE